MRQVLFDRVTITTFQVIQVMELPQICRCLERFFLVVDVEVNVRVLLEAHRRTDSLFR